MAENTQPTTYDTKIGQPWRHGQEWIGAYNMRHLYLGPCPLCGTRTFDYGGGWRCMALNCNNNETNPAPNVGPKPAWWNTGIQVYKDGNQWCAVKPDFVNLQVSPAGFGGSPQKAVDDLLSQNMAIAAHAPQDNAAPVPSRIVWTPEQVDTIFSALREAERVVADLIELASAAMLEANRDCAGYDVEGELKEYRASLSTLHALLPQETLEVKL